MKFLLGHKRYNARKVKQVLKYTTNNQKLPKRCPISYLRISTAVEAPHRRHTSTVEDMSLKDGLWNEDKFSSGSRCSWKTREMHRPSYVHFANSANRIKRRGEWRPRSADLARTLSEESKQARTTALPPCIYIPVLALAEWQIPLKKEKKPSEEAKRAFARFHFSWLVHAASDATTRRRGK